MHLSLLLGLAIASSDSNILDPAVILSNPSPEDTVEQLPVLTTLSNGSVAVIAPTWVMRGLEAVQTVATRTLQANRTHTLTVADDETGMLTVKTLTLGDGGKPTSTAWLKATSPKAPATITVTTSQWLDRIFTYRQAITTTLTSTVTRSRTQEPVTITTSIEVPTTEILTTYTSCPETKRITELVTRLSTHHITDLVTDTERVTSTKTTVTKQPIQEDIMPDFEEQESCSCIHFHSCRHGQRRSVLPTITKVIRTTVVEDESDWLDEVTTLKPFPTRKPRRFRTKRPHRIWTKLPEILSQITKLPFATTSEEILPSTSSAVDVLPDESFPEYSSWRPRRTLLPPRPEKIPVSSSQKDSAKDTSTKTTSSTAKVDDSSVSCKPSTVTKTASAKIVTTTRLHLLTIQPKPTTMTQIVDRIFIKPTTKTLQPILSTATIHLQPITRTKTKHSTITAYKSVKTVGYHQVTVTKTLPRTHTKIITSTTELCTTTLPIKDRVRKHTEHRALCREARHDLLARLTVNCTADAIDPVQLKFDLPPELDQHYQGLSIPGDDCFGDLIKARDERNPTRQVRLLEAIQSRFCGTDKNDQVVTHYITSTLYDGRVRSTV